MLDVKFGASAAFNAEIRIRTLSACHTDCNRPAVPCRNSDSAPHAFHNDESFVNVEEWERHDHRNVEVRSVTLQGNVPLRMVRVHKWRGQLEAIYCAFPCAGISNVGKKICRCFGGPDWWGSKRIRAYFLSEPAALRSTPSAWHFPGLTAEEKTQYRHSDCWFEPVAPRPPRFPAFFRFFFEISGNASGSRWKFLKELYDRRLLSGMSHIFGRSFGVGDQTGVGSFFK